MKIKTILSGNRLFLKEIEEQELLEVLSCYKKALSYFELVTGRREIGITTVELQFKERKADKNSFFLGIRFLNDKKLAGIVDIKTNFPRKEEAVVELLLISEDYQRRGYGKEALSLIEKFLFESVRLIRAGVVNQNIKALRFWENAGYVKAENPFSKDSVKDGSASGGKGMVWFAKAKNRRL
jgi:RimJ/RimL family protein N-acetyltransferase